MFIGCLCWARLQCEVTLSLDRNSLVHTDPKEGIIPPSLGPGKAKLSLTGDRGADKVASPQCLLPSYQVTMATKRMVLGVG